MKKDQGYFLISILVFAAISVAAISGLVTFANTNLLAGQRAIQSEQAFQLAEAGIEYYKWHLAHAGTDYADGGGAFPHTHNFYDKSGNLLGVFNLTITPPGTETSVTIKSEGVPASNANIKRTIVVKFGMGEGASFQYGIQSGTGGFALGNNAQIHGSVYSNGSINGGNGSIITGDAYAVGSINDVNTGGSHPNSPLATLPLTDSDILGWKAEATSTNNIFVGNKFLTGTNNSLGPMKIQGNLTLDNNSTLSLTGTVWVTGNVSLSNSSTISLASSYGAGSGVLVADGTITFGNSAIVSGSGTTGSALMLLTTSSASQAISLGNGAIAQILYAPNGTISLGNSADLKVMVAKTISLGNGVDLTYEQGGIGVSFTNGPSGGWHTFSWQELGL